MRQAIAETKPKRAPGGKVAYSNYGYGLLGYALAQRARNELRRARARADHVAARPAHTALDTPGLTQGHGFFGRPTGPWQLASVAGAGGLRSTARDMLAYLAIHSTDGPLAAAARETRVRRGAMGALGVGLGWVILPAGSGPKWVRLEHETLMHDGGTGGYRSFASVVPETGKAVIVLGSRARSVTGLGTKLMRAL